jgi:NTE family protein
MASGALPPALPAIVIDGAAYWDGGLVSNTPLQYVLDGGSPCDDMCIFQVDLFSARGQLPQTLSDVLQREKEIRFSSRTRLNTDVMRELQTLRRAASRLYRKLPEALKSDPDALILEDHGCDAAITIVQLIHRAAAYETLSKDYEFSRVSIEERWEAGCADVRRTLTHKAWKTRTRPTEGVATFDLTREEAM